MNHVAPSCQDFCMSLSDISLPTDIAVGIAPPFPLLSMCRRSLNEDILLLAQNCHEKQYGAYTGEVSAQLLKSIGCSSVILGHSERRQIFHESDALILKKMKTAIDSNLQVIFCCGESLDQRKSATHKSYIREQLEQSIAKLSPEQLSSCIIAYEPIWAIGTGETASAEQAEEMCSFIRSYIEEYHGTLKAEKIVILYGGSVKPSNCIELFNQENIDGGLIGGASIDSHLFAEIIKLSTSLT